jgi:hypothetical protein
VNAAAIDERTNGLVAAHRAELEQLVRWAVDAEVARLVDLELAGRNVNGHEPVVAPVEARMCLVRGERPSAAGPHRLLGMW